MALSETETKKVKMKLTKFQKHLLLKALKNETDKIQLELENNNSEIIRDISIFRN